MRFTSTPALCLAASFASSALAISFAPREADRPLRVVQHDIARRNVPNPVLHDRRRRQKRDGTISAALTNEETLYFINVTVGTPGQSLRLHIDTGSSDMWVNTATSELCSYEGQDYCAYAGTYSPNDSSTYEYINSLFDITYEDGSGASGDYVSDVVVIGGTTITDQEFGIGYDSTSEEGILGVGYVTDEAILATSDPTSYPNVPAKMLAEGLIGANAYSLWLNDLDASTGSILFGGINTDKYSGDLSVLPIIKVDGEYAAFYIALTELGANGTAGSYSKDLETAVLLDSGTSLTYLADNLTDLIYEDIDVTYDSTEGAAIIDCSRADDDYSIDYTFSGVTISVTMAELVIPIGTSDGKEVCVFGIAPAEGADPVLGDTFLRSAYVVYDLSSNQIGLATTVFNATTDNIVEITNTTSTTEGIPDATVVANAVSSVPSDQSTSGAVDSSTASSSGALPTAAPGSRMVQGLGAAGAVALGALLAL